jgi:hypothetical protein
MALPSSPIDWNESHVREWLTEVGFGSYAHVLCDVHKINGTALLMLSEKDLKSPPINMEVCFENELVVYNCPIFFLSSSFRF